MDSFYIYIYLGIRSLLIIDLKKNLSLPPYYFEKKDPNNFFLLGLCNFEFKEFF